MSAHLRQILIQAAHENPALRKALVPVLRASWDPGDVVPEGYDTGGKVRREHDDVGVGSQVPPAHDHKGNPIAVDGEFEKAAMRVLGKDSLTPVLGLLEAGVMSRVGYIGRILDQRFRAKVAGYKGGLKLRMSLDPTRRKWVIRGAMEHTPGSRQEILEVLGELGDVTLSTKPVGLRKRGKFADIPHGSEFFLLNPYYGDLTYKSPVIRVGKNLTTMSTMSRTAGEVRFIKDKSGDEKQWGWANTGPSEREITPDYQFRPTKLKPLAKTLRASLAALGHAMSAYHTFSKIKSATVSPDGSLGGKGYIQKISEMRRQFMNVVEGLSALTDTIYDELQAPHWNPAVKSQGVREREKVKEILQDAEEIREDPEGWAKEEEEEMSGE